MIHELNLFPNNRPTDPLTKTVLSSGAGYAEFFWHFHYIALA